jgi:GAF domain-containing protein
MRFSGVHINVHKHDWKHICGNTCNLVLVTEAWPHDTFWHSNQCTHPKLVRTSRMRCSEMSTLIALHLHNMYHICTNHQGSYSHSFRWICPQYVDAKVGLVDSYTYTYTQNHDCRGVHPCHQLYLQNMGVKASLAISIIIGGKLWGLVVFHHCSGAARNFSLRSLYA